MTISHRAPSIRLLRRSDPPSPSQTASTPAQTGSNVAGSAAPSAGSAPAASSISSNSPDMGSNSFVNHAMVNPSMASAQSVAPSPLALPPASVAPSPAQSNLSTILVGAGLIAAVALISVVGVFVYRRRLHKRQDACMFLEVGRKDLPIRAPPPAIVQPHSKAKRIGDPMLVNTSAFEVLRGPGVITAGSTTASSPVMSNATPRSPSPKYKRDKPKLSLAMYRTSNASTVSGSGNSSNTAHSPSPSPRYRTVPDMFGEGGHLGVHTPTYAPSPRRLSSFDCAPSPMPTDSRQRYGRYQYGDDAALQGSSTPRVVGHRRTASTHRTSSQSTNSNKNLRQAFYGQQGLNRLSAATSVGGDSLLSIPISARHSFEQEVTGMY